MKKIIALLLAAALFMSLVACSNKKAEEEKAAENVEVVTYFCSIGAYLDTLQEEVDKWNKTTGAEEGIFIQITSDINSYDTSLDALLSSGNYYDIVDIGLDYAYYVNDGHVRDLRTIDDPDLKALIDSYAEYNQEGFNIRYGVLYALPLEIVPIKFAVNTDLFEKNGLELPKTWEDVRNAAKVITENGEGKEFGFGWSNWDWCFSRLMMKFSASSTGKLWWDPNTETYDFAQYEYPMQILTEMYQNGWMLGADDLGIDEIRAQFAAGNVGMFPAPSYDVGVYTSQFPAQCNWTVIDPPTFEEGEAPYKGVYLERLNCSITTGVSEERLAKVTKAFVFLNSDELNQKIYQKGGMIPYKTSLMEGVELETKIPQFELMADVTNYAPFCRYPDYDVVFEGDDPNVVFSAVMHGDIDFAEAAEDLRTRLQDGYDAFKDREDFARSYFAYEYSLEK